MIISATITKIHIDNDNDVEQIDFVDKEKALTGYIELPLSFFSFENAGLHQIELEIQPADFEIKEEKSDRLKIAFNTKFYRLSKSGENTTRHFSAGGLLVTLTSKKPLDIAGSDEREFKILVRTK